MSSKKETNSSGCLGLIVIIIIVFMSSKFGLLNTFSSNNSSDDNKEYIEFSKESQKFNDDFINSATKNLPVLLNEESKMFKNSYLKRTINEQDFDYIYFGDLKDEMPDGDGVLFQIAYSDIGKLVIAPLYIGEFEKGMFDGYGIQFLLLGNVYDSPILLKLGVTYKAYEGYFEEGELEGKGNLYYMSDILENVIGLEEYAEKYQEDFETFENEFYNSDEIIFYSPTEPFKSSIKYSGDFQKSEFSGKGHLYDFESNLIYFGEFSNGKYNGKGTKFFRSGTEEYRGEFSNSLYHGKGILYNKDGSVKYDGQFRKGDVK